MKGLNVSISNGNSKMGAIRSVSLPPQKTCPKCACWKDCYINKLIAIRPSVRNAYERNLTILLEDPEKYWREVTYAVMMSRNFRFHVSGDIVDDAYFRSMITVAENSDWCQILVFTKRYGIVNNAIASGTKIPNNLHVIFSVWPGLECDNPYNLPEAHVRFKDGSTTARPDAFECGGNCAECAVTDCGCWVLKNGEQVVFNKH